LFQNTGFFRYIIFSFIFFVSVFFVSRMNMVFMFVVMIFSIRSWFTRGKINRLTKLVISSMLIVSSYVFVKLVYPILYYTVPLINQYFISTNIKTQNYSISYGSGSQAYLLDIMWKIPESITGFIFGTGALPVRSDIGYVKVLFMTGIIGILILIFYYGYIIRALKRKLIIIDKYRLNTYDSYIKNIPKSFIVIISLLFLYNFKNLFLFSRTFHELIIILFFTFLADVNRPKVFHSDNNTKLYPS